MKLYAVMYWLDKDMNPADTCLCFESYDKYDVQRDPCIYQTRKAAEQEMKRQIKIAGHLPHAVFEMSNE